jgi:hypothetical protein
MMLNHLTSFKFLKEIYPLCHSQSIEKRHPYDMAENVIRRISVRSFPLADFSYVAGLRTFGPVGDFKFNRLTLF